MRPLAVHGIFGWWDDAVTVANRLAMENGRRYRVERFTHAAGRWAIVDPYPRAAGR